MCKKAIIITILAALMGIMGTASAGDDPPNNSPYPMWVVWCNDWGNGDGQYTVGDNWRAKPAGQQWTPAYADWSEYGLVPTSEDHVVFDFSKGLTHADHAIDVVINPGQVGYGFDMYGPLFKTQLPAGNYTPADDNDSSFTMYGGSLTLGNNTATGFGNGYWFKDDGPADGMVSRFNMLGNSRFEMKGDLRIGFNRLGGSKSDLFTSTFNISDNAHFKIGGKLDARNCLFDAKIVGNAVLELGGNIIICDDSRKSKIEIAENATVIADGIGAATGTDSLGKILISGGTVNLKGTGGTLSIGRGEGVIKITGGVINSKGSMSLMCGAYYDPTSSTLKPAIGDPNSYIIMEGGEAHFARSLNMFTGKDSGNSDIEFPDRRAVLIMKGGVLEIKGEDDGVFAFPAKLRVREATSPDPNLHCKMYLMGGAIKAGGAKWYCPNYKAFSIDVNDANEGGMFAVGGDANAFIDMSYAAAAVPAKLTSKVTNPNNILRFAYMPVNGNYKGVTYLGITHKNKAWGQIPYDGQKKSISSSVVLNWNPGEPLSGQTITGQKLYAGTNKASLTLVNGTLGAAIKTYTLNSIPPYIVYYWRIDTVTSSGTVTGDVWEFGGSPDGLATNPNPADNGTQTDLVTGTVSWTKATFPGLVAQDIYFGTAADALVKISDADANVPQSETITPANVKIGDRFILTATGEDFSTAVISFTATEATVANVTAGLTALWNASTNPLCTPVTAVNNTTSLTLKADTAGVPFDVTASTIQVDTFTPANVEIGDRFTLTAYGPFGGGVMTIISYTATEASVANVTAGLTALWNDSTNPLCTPVTAADNTTNLTLTADVAGVAFNVTATTGNGGANPSQTLTKTPAVPHTLTKTTNVRQTINTGELIIGTTYYWRVDSYFNIFPSVATTGNLWKFATTDYLGFEDFETYTDYTTLHNTWTDGYADFTSGAYINLTEDETRVRSGSKSAVMNLWTDGMDNAIVSRPIPTAAKNWSNMQVLTLYFLGDPGNAYPVCYANEGEVSKLYAAIDDDADPTDATKLYYDGDANDMFVSGWHEWNMPLAGFTGVDLTNVQSLGIGADVTPVAYGPIIAIDDIVLRMQVCPSPSRLAADFNKDCIVDSDDMSLMSEGWLQSGAAADIYPPFSGGIPAGDKMVDLRDYSVLGSEWLAESLIP